MHSCQASFSFLSRLRRCRIGAAVGPLTMATMRTRDRRGTPRPPLPAELLPTARGVPDPSTRRSARRSRSSPRAGSGEWRDTRRAHGHSCFASHPYRFSCWSWCNSCRLRTFRVILWSTISTVCRSRSQHEVGASGERDAVVLRTEPVLDPEDVVVLQQPRRDRPAHELLRPRPPPVVGRQLLPVPRFPQRVQRHLLDRPVRRPCCPRPVRRLERPMHHRAVPPPFRCEPIGSESFDVRVPVATRAQRVLPTRRHRMPARVARVGGVDMQRRGTKRGPGGTACEEPCRQRANGVGHDRPAHTDLPNHRNVVCSSTPS